jgi:hypothetical protein
MWNDALKKERYQRAKKLRGLKSWLEPGPTSIKERIDLFIEIVVFGIFATLFLPGAYFFFSLFQRNNFGD